MLRLQTIDNTREADATIVQPDDEEAVQSVAEDEFAAHFHREVAPSLLVTTNRRPSARMFEFLTNLFETLPSATFYARRAYNVRERARVRACHWRAVVTHARDTPPRRAPPSHLALCVHTQIAQIMKYAADAGFTNLLVFHETKKFSQGSRVDGLLLVHLPAGPSAMFRISNVKLTKDISGHGRPSAHIPELILNNFTTALGHRVGRLLASLLPQDPEFRGRRVITMHNQRDFIFFRHHRYVFEQRQGPRKREHTGHLAPAIAPPPPGVNRKKKKKGPKAAQQQQQQAMSPGEGGDGQDGHVVARLQELGPRFTLKLQVRVYVCVRATPPRRRP